MFQTLLKGVGRWALLLVAMAFLTLVSIFVVGGFFVTFPVMRMSPRDRRIKSTVDFVSSGMTMVTAFSEGSLKKAIADSMAEPTQSTYPYQDGPHTVIGPECFTDEEATVINWKGGNYVLDSVDASEIFAVEPDTEPITVKEFVNEWVEPKGEDQ